MLYCVMSCYTTLHYAVLCHAMLYYAILCDVMLSYAMLCDVVLCGFIRSGNLGFVVSCTILLECCFILFAFVILNHVIHPLHTYHHINIFMTIAVTLASP